MSSAMRSESSGSSDNHRSADRASSWHDQIDDFIELVNVTAFLGDITMRNIARHFAVADTPRHAVLGVEPDDLFGLLLYFPQDPLVGAIVVVPPIADDQHSGLAGDGRKIVFVKQFERTAEIGVGKDVDHPALERCFHGSVNLVLLEKFRDLAYVADKHKTANLGVEILHRVNKLQHEARGIQYGVRDVAQDYDLRLGFSAPVQLDVKGHAAVLQISSERSLDVEPTAGGFFASHRQAIF